MATAGQVEAHEAVMRAQKRRVDGEVGRRARVRLHVDAPLGRVEAERLEGAIAGEVLDLFVWVEGFE